jgi:hypothetical protein
MHHILAGINACHTFEAGRAVLDYELLRRRGKKLDGSNLGARKSLILMPILPESRGLFLSLDLIGTVFSSTYKFADHMS